MDTIWKSMAVFRCSDDPKRGREWSPNEDEPPRQLSLTGQGALPNRDLQILGRPECDFLACFDLDDLAGRRIAPHASGSFSYLQDAKPGNSYSFALLQMLGDQSDQVVKEFALRPFRQLVLFGQACGELGKRNRKLVSHLFPLVLV